MLDRSDPRIDGLGHLLMFLINLKIKSADARVFFGLDKLTMPYGYDIIKNEVNKVARTYVNRVERRVRERRKME